MKTRSVAQNSAFALAGDLASKGGTVVLMMVAGRALSTAEFAVLGREPEALATVLIAAAGAAQLSLTGALRSARDLRPEALAKLLAGVLTVLFGPRFAGAAPALVVLAAATAASTTAGVLGTALVALRRLRPLGLQVGVSLAINLAVIVLLVPSLGAIGAATATLACEFAALVLLAVATVRALHELIVQTPRASPLPSAITARVGR